MNISKKSADYSRISVIVQGPVDPQHTPACLECIRKHIPMARIILSTWEGSDVGGLDFDDIVLSADPQASNPLPTNINRMIVSTRAGLEKAKTMYALKMRTDFILTGNNFLSFAKENPDRSEKLRIFKERVICCGWKLRPKSIKPRLFHPADFLFYGLTEDICKLFSVPLCTKEMLNWFPQNKPSMNPGAMRKLLSKINHRNIAESNRFHTEQYLLLELFKKQNLQIDIADYFHKNQELFELSEFIYANNFIFLTFPEFSIKVLKSALARNNTGVSGRFYTFKQWSALCKNYCDKNYNFSSHPGELSLPKKTAITAILAAGDFASNFLPSKKKRKDFRAKLINKVTSKI